jgi:hypothetical protein
LEEQYKAAGQKVLSQEDLKKFLWEKEKEALIEMIKEGRHTSLLIEEKKTLGRTPQSYVPYKHGD